MAVIERFGGCRHGKQRVVRKKVKSRIKTVTEVLPPRGNEKLILYLA
jgi:hypothetical protein